MWSRLVAAAASPPTLFAEDDRYPPTHTHTRIQHAAYLKVNKGESQLLLRLCGAEFGAGQSHGVVDKVAGHTYQRSHQPQQPLGCAHDWGFHPEGVGGGKSRMWIIGSRSRSLGRAHDRGFHPEGMGSSSTLSRSLLGSTSSGLHATESNQCTAKTTMASVTSCVTSYTVHFGESCDGGGAAGCG